MVNIIVYLKKEYNAKKILEHLLLEKLIASASIDENNILYKLENDALTEEIYSAITLQSKALLFYEIVKTIESLTGEECLITSTPIVGSNKFFDDIIRKKTITI